MSGWLDDKVFSSGIASLPLVSIDLVVRDKTSGQYLFGWRRNRPAADHWFVPGGRVQKNETLDDAFARLTKAELGAGKSRSTAQWLGVYQHFYEDCVFGEGISTHYIVLAYEIVVNIGALNLPTEQHSKYQWMTKDEIGGSNLVHQYSKDYFR
ncbi:GDP-mannose mannosyl hydrolase [Zhongshania sp. BJYM1]|uniref:GDP-mannose mannosyl hydrolase n=1 Tax=Zhongshania aquatica TaxID=2965069 RepID=UPI0022B345D9|nr:GDP-mannose mannosyl hydrolase [Marortus sp. BJYM1]